MKVIEPSFLYFVYPFLFEAETFEARVQRIEGAQWPGRERPLPVWKNDPFPEDDLLSHVARYLNPQGGTPPTARLWQLDGNTLQSPNGLGGGADWRLLYPQGDLPFRFPTRRASLHLEPVQLALFRMGVGFLTVGASPTTLEGEDWLDFLHYFRFVRGQRKVSVRAQRRTGREEVSPFFPEPAGGPAQHPGGRGVFGEVLDALLRTATTEDDSGNWWSEVFVPGQLIPYAVLFVNEVTEEEVPVLLYRMHNFFHSRQEIHPAPEDLCPDHPGLLPYAEGQWFVFSLEGGAFVACDAPDTQFFRETLPNHLRDQYFLLFLLSLHQRFTLMSLSQQVSEEWFGRDEMERARDFDLLRDRLLEFTARGYFAQVMQREHHHRCYRRWQETFQIDRLYQEVNDEVREMHDYLLMKRTEHLEELAEAQRQQMEAAAQEEEKRAQHLERRISLLGVFIGVPAVLISFMGVNLRGITASEGLTLLQALLTGFGGGLFLALLIIAALWLRRR
jgi:hypothetical protein